jgi:hypothetical protein
VDDARFEIWFPSTDEVSIFIETPATGEARELVEIGLFAAFAARQVANLRKDEAMQPMCYALTQLPHAEGGDEIPDAIGETRIVSPSPNQGRKGFVGTYKNRNGLPLVNLKPRGFGMMGRGVGFYAPTATIALLFSCLKGMSEEGRFVLIETAHNVGQLGLGGHIGVTSQAKMAGAAVSAAVDSLQASSPLSERADDPEEDYQLLLSKTEQMLGQIVDELSNGDPDQHTIVPDWMGWRVCQEMTVLHYELYDEELHRLRSEGAPHRVGARRVRRLPGGRPRGERSDTRR